MDELIARIYNRCEEVGDCWEWQGAVQSTSGCPVMRYLNKTISVRRVLALHLSAPCDGKLVTNRCTNLLCVNPDHVVVVTRKVLQRRTAKENPRYLSITRRTRLAQSARSRAKLTPEQVQAIRDDIRPQRVIAKHYGITQGYVSAIKNMKKWIDFSNPFVSLLT